MREDVNFYLPQVSIVFIICFIMIIEVRMLTKTLFDEKRLVGLFIPVILLLQHSTLEFFGFSGIQCPSIWDFLRFQKALALAVAQQADGFECN
jgi:hypothetical protein